MKLLPVMLSLCSTVVGRLCFLSWSAWAFILVLSALLTLNGRILPVSRGRLLGRKQQRKSKRAVEKGVEEAHVVEEGVTYEAGGF